MKRIISFLLIIIFSVLLFVGCDEEKTDGSFVTDINPLHTNTIVPVESTTPLQTTTPVGNRTTPALSETAKPAVTENVINRPISVDLSGKVQMALDYVNSESGKVYFTISNLTAETYNYGQDFELEKYENGIWNKMPFKESAEFTCEAMLLLPDEEHTGCSVSLPEYFEHLSVGSYRLIKTFYGNGGYADLYMTFELDREL